VKWRTGGRQDGRNSLESTGKGRILVDNGGKKPKPGASFPKRTWGPSNENGFSVSDRSV
tara:strand:- start:1007 stop:1183 length:177 start_codon:yes stop_codon:yes gene_type:complete